MAVRVADQIIPIRGPDDPRRGHVIRPHPGGEIGPPRDIEASEVDLLLAEAK